MIQKIKNNLLILASALMLLAPAALPAAASAACSHTANQIANGAQEAVGNNVDCNAPGSGLGGLGNVAKRIVDIFSVLVGIVAVIMIIYGGFRYITSGGDSGSVGNAKNTLIYAIVGLVIVALAQVIVRFVLSTTSSAVG